MADVPTRHAPPLDHDAVASLFRPGGQWATDSGTNVRELRRDLNVTVAKLAADLCVGVPTVYRIETGGILPSDRLRMLIAYYLDTRPDALWTYPTRRQLEDIVGRVS